jgi:hypothetical protein
MATAILVDGAFFIRRFETCFPDHDSREPKSVAHALRLLANWHITQRIGASRVWSKWIEVSFWLSLESFTAYFFTTASL